MIISLIVAIDEEGGIGREGNLPWHLSDDLKRFKRLTMGHHLVLGRKTFESMGRLLLGRTIIVITRDPHYSYKGCLVVHSLESALSIARGEGEREVFVGGGGKVFSQALPLVDRIYLTKVHTHAACDVFFPDFPLDEWSEVERDFHPADRGNDYPSTYTLLVRNSRGNSSMLQQDEF